MREEKKPYDENVENGMWKFLCGEHKPSEGLVLGSLIKMIYIFLVAALHLLFNFSYISSHEFAFSHSPERKIEITYGL